MAPRLAFLRKKLFAQQHAGAELGNSAETRKSIINESTPIPNNKTNVVIGPSFRLSSPTIPKGRQAASWAKHLSQCSRRAAADTSASAASYRIAPTTSGSAVGGSCALPEDTVFSVYRPLPSPQHHPSPLSSVVYTCTVPSQPEACVARVFLSSCWLRESDSPNVRT